MNKAMSYLTEVKNMSAEQAERILEPIRKHEDIFLELEKWIDSKSYDCDNQLLVEGYSARDISNLAPFMDGIGVYNFLVSLRERPEKGKKIIDAGFPRK
jgi:hypothetical protein